MSWEKEVNEIRQRKTLAKEMGGTEAVEKHHGKGRLTVRERINGFLDVGSFKEHGEGAGFAEKDPNGEISKFSPANYVVGVGKVSEKLVVVGGEDFFSGPSF